MIYRKEIDGLRAIAILPVVFFHAGFSYASGGYVGVDIFLVISGYLITSLILSDRSNNKFSLLNFYERRARRILPALFLIILLSIPFAFLLMLPIELTNFSWSVLATTFFSSNIFFWREAGYFASPSELKPLLHTWSLSVEEQFYVLFPLFLLIILRFKLNTSLLFILLLTFLSLGLAQIASSKFPSANFYLLPTRGWELLCGSILAFYFFSNPKKKVFHSNLLNDLFSLIGILLIVYSIIFFNDKTPFPSFWTLFPVIGTSLLILFTNKESYIGRFLSVKPLVFFGLISYSLYLFHQPIFAYSRIYTFDSINEANYYLLMLLAIVFSYLSWRFFESPFRNRDKISTKFLTFSILGMTCFFVFISSLVIKNNGFYERYDLDEDLVETMTRDDNEECFAIHFAHSSLEWGCDLGDTNSETNYDFVLFGDSHANTYINIVNKLATKNNKKGFFAGISGCPPLLGVNSFDPPNGPFNCEKLNERVLNFIKINKIKNLILVARWSYYTHGDFKQQDIRFLRTDTFAQKELESSKKAFNQGLERTIEAYENIGVKVIIIKQYPQQRINPKDLFYRKINESNFPELIEKYSITKEKNSEINYFANNLFSNISYESFNLIDFSPSFCSTKCLMGDQNGSYYYDDDHLSDYGMSLISDDINNLIISLD